MIFYIDVYRFLPHPKCPNNFKHVVLPHPIVMFEISPPTHKLQCHIPSHPANVNCICPPHPTNLQCEIHYSEDAS